MKGSNNMKNIMKKAAQSLLLVPALALGVSLVPMATPVSAATCSETDVTLSSGAACSKSDEQQEKLFGVDGIFQTITNVLLFLIGAVSVIMLIYGGIRYTVSGGDSNSVTAAKNTILYAVVGIVVAILAYAAVNFVIGNLAAGQ